MCAVVAETTPQSVSTAADLSRAITMTLKVEDVPVKEQGEIWVIVATCDLPERLADRLEPFFASSEIEELLRVSWREAQKSARSCGASGQTMCTSGSTIVPRARVSEHLRASAHRNNSARVTTGRTSSQRSAKHARNAIDS